MSVILFALRRSLTLQALESVTKRGELEVYNVIARWQVGGLKRRYLVMVVWFKTSLRGVMYVV